MDMDKDNDIDIKDVKLWFKSKTVWLGIFTITGSIVEFLAGVNPGAAIGTLVVGILGIIFRYMTNTALVK